VPEGDTIHRAARRMQVALGGREIDLADAPNPRSPIHRHAGDLVLHSHLGMNGRWWITADGRLPYGKPWLRLASGRGIASQTGGKILRIVSESKLRNDPSLRRLGPDPLRPGFDPAVAAQRLRSGGAMREIGDALLDQELIAGLGNVIRVEGLFRARISPWRRVNELTDEELLAVVVENKKVMDISMAKGRRPVAMYKAHRRGCPNCGGEVRSRGQGDDNRTAFWCPRCQV
jgi:endonuclease VIII